MKVQNILFTADLHLNIDARSLDGQRILDVFEGAVKRNNPDAVVVAGDLSTPSKASQHIALIRKAVGDRPLAVALGNHDFWTGNIVGKGFHLLENTISSFWETPCRENGITLLDLENANWGETTIVGGYGHFDLGLAWPDLKIHGKPVTREDYLAGNGWNDFRFIPGCAEFLDVNARAQANGIALRLDQAIQTNRRILMAMHTCPWPQLNGHPKSGSYSDLFTGYSGNSLVGQEIEKCSSHVEFLMCGHTHYLVKEQRLHGIPSLNVGADYGVFRAVIYNVETKEICWI
jgi:predicted phosphodiesterase